MKTQLPSKYPSKSSHEPLGVREPQVENLCPSVNCTLFLLQNVLIEQKSNHLSEQVFLFNFFNLFVCEQT